MKEGTLLFKIPCDYKFACANRTFNDYGFMILFTILMFFNALRVVPCSPRTEQQNAPLLCRPRRARPESPVFSAALPLSFQFAYIAAGCQPRLQTVIGTFISRYGGRDHRSIFQLHVSEAGVDPFRLFASGLVAVIHCSGLFFCHFRLLLARQLMTVEYPLLFYLGRRFCLGACFVR